MAGEEKCNRCNGTGVCPRCLGAGLVWDPDIFDENKKRIECPACKGNCNCNVCQGTGKTKKQ